VPPACPLWTGFVPLLCSQRSVNSPVSQSLTLFVAKPCGHKMGFTIFPQCLHDFLLSVYRAWSRVGGADGWCSGNLVQADHASWTIAFSSCAPSGIKLLPACGSAVSPASSSSPMALLSFLAIPSSAALFYLCSPVQVSHPS
jgi:hypothetical protein